nr:hypothetical protein [Pontibacter ummariensis]
MTSISAAIFNRFCHWDCRPRQWYCRFLLLDFFLLLVVVLFFFFNFRQTKSSSKLLSSGSCYEWSGVGTERHLHADAGCVRVCPQKRKENGLGYLRRLPDGIGKGGDKTTLVQINLYGYLLQISVFDCIRALWLKMRMAAVTGAEWGTPVRFVILMVLVPISHSHCLRFTRSRVCPVQARFQGKRQ